MPVGTPMSSAVATSAFPPNSSSTPTAAEPSHSRGRGRRHPPRSRLSTSRTAPATRKRIAGPTSGGIDTFERSIARYVVPQKKYTVTRPVQIFAELGPRASSSGIGR
jgi:hypothetical protein